MVKTIVVTCQLLFDRLELTNVVEQLVDIGMHRDNVIDQMFVIRFCLTLLSTIIFTQFFSWVRISRVISTSLSCDSQIIYFFRLSNALCYLLLRELAVQSDLLQVTATFANCRVRLALRIRMTSLAGVTLTLARRFDRLNLILTANV